MFSKQLLDARADLWAAQTDHSFVRELAAGPLGEVLVEHWVRGPVDKHDPGQFTHQQARVERPFPRTGNRDVAFFETVYESTGKESDAEERKREV